MALWDAILNVDFGINEYGDNEAEVETRLRDSLPPEVSDAIDTLKDSGWVDLSWTFELVNHSEFATDFWRGKRGEDG